MSKIKQALSESVAFRVKQASYDPNSLSGKIENAKSKEEIEAAIAGKIQEYQESGRLSHKGGLLSYLIGPNTSVSGFGPLALMAKAVNAIRPGSMSYKLTPKINMAGMSGEEIIEDFTNNSAKYMKSISPDITKKVYDTVAAHEILEAEAMDKNISGLTNLVGGMQTGGLLGAVAGAIPAVMALRDLKKGKIQSPDLGLSLLMPAYAGMVGSGFGAIAGGAYNWLTGQKAMDDAWSSHMSADIPRLESMMVNKMGDPALVEIFKAMRTQTGERRAIQEGAMQDYGETIGRDKLEAIQKIDPMGFMDTDDDQALMQEILKYT